jgi:hypothetical protein
MSVYFLMFLAIASPEALADGNAKNGEVISRLHCARCHVVSEDNLFAGIGSTPSFMLMVNALKDWEERFSTFYTRRPHPVHVRIEGLDKLTNLPSNAAPIELNLNDVDDILAYARSLQKD